MNPLTERRYKRVESKGEELGREIAELAATIEASRQEMIEFLTYCANLGIGDVDPAVRLKIVRFKAAELLAKNQEEANAL